MLASSQNPERVSKDLRSSTETMRVIGMCAGTTARAERGSTVWSGPV